MHSHRRLLIPRRSLGSSLARWMATSTLSLFTWPICSSAQPRETLYSLLRSTTASTPSTPILLLASNFGRPASLGPGSPRCPGSIPVLLLPPTTYSQRSASRRRLSLTRRRTPSMSRRRRRKRWAQGAATARLLRSSLACPQYHDRRRKVWGTRFHLGPKLCLAAPFQPARPAAVQRHDLHWLWIAWRPLQLAWRRRACWRCGRQSVCHNWQRFLRRDDQFLRVRSEVQSGGFAGRLVHSL